jgi:hypothetical protein
VVLERQQRRDRRDRHERRRARRVGQVVQCEMVQDEVAADPPGSLPLVRVWLLSPPVYDRATEAEGAARGRARASPPAAPAHCQLLGVLAGPPAPARSAATQGRAAAAVSSGPGALGWCRTAWGAGRVCVWACRAGSGGWMGSLGSAAVCSWLAAARGAGGAVWRATVCAASLVDQKPPLQIIIVTQDYTAD